MNNIVSVISPAYNAEKHLKKLVDCVSNQSIKVLEHIIIDDGSTDNTLNELRALEQKFSHIKVITQDNQGAGVARNKGISIAKGDYIAFLDADDEWAEDKLKVQIEFMESENISFSYGDYFEVDGDTGKVINERHTPDKLTYTDLLKSCPIGCLTVVFNQNKLGKLFMPAIRRGQDWALWLLITKRGVVAYRFPGIFAYYTIAHGSLSRNKYKKIMNMYKIYEMQGLGHVKSLYYLFLHILYRLRK